MCVVLLTSIGITVLILTVFKSLLPASLTEAKRSNGGWMEDEEMISLVGNSCDIEIVDAKKMSSTRFDRE